jgi:putative ATP-binding cassette transporter
VLVGLASGFGSASLIVLINIATNRPPDERGGIAFAYLGLCIAVLITGIGSQILSTYAGQSAIYDIRMRLSDRVAAAPLRQLETIGPNRVLATLTEDINSIAMSLLSISELCIGIVTLLVSLIYLAYLSWTEFAALCGFIVLGVTIYEILQSRALRYLKEAREVRDSLMAHFRALTEGCKELRLHRRRREDFLALNLGAQARSLMRHNLLGFTSFAVAASWSQFLFFTVIGLLLFALPLVRGVRHDVLTGYIIAVLYIRGPIGTIITALPVIGQGNIALRKVQSLGITLSNEASAVTVSDRGPDLPFGSLLLRGITHSYHGSDNHFVLGPLEVLFEPGETVFLVGGNGSGKTTFAKILTGLYQPDSGEIQMAGRLISDHNRESYRQHFSAVFSDFYLFDSFVGLSTPGLDGRAADYLGKLDLAHKVCVKNGVLSTTELSQGQRKRLALLTAYLEDRPFLVFDEWASDQDPQFKEVFYTQLLPELKDRGKAVLVITHDDRYLRVADRVVKLDSGKISCQTAASEPPPFEMNSGRPSIHL